MKPDFDYATVPYGFVHCLHAQCPYAANCLRYQVAQRIPPECNSISIVNPSFTPPKKKECSYFLEDRLQRFAIGIKHFFDKLPHEDAIYIKRQMIAHFTHSAYYRYWRNERAFSPDDQAHIRKLFLKRGITDEPAYDEYKELYEW